VTIAQILSEFGAYYLKNGQNLASLYMQLFQASVTEGIFTPVLTDETVWRASEARHTRVLQPFQKAWTPVGAATFLPVSIQQHQMKADLEEYPDDLKATWLGFLASNSLDRKTWPFVRWWMEKLVIPKLKEDLEMNEIWSGVAAAPTAGTPGAAGTAMNGLKKIIADLITASRITPIVTGAWDADDLVFVDQVESFVDAINTKYWSLSMELCMSQKIERRYARAFRKKYGKDTDYKDANGKVKDTNLTIKGLPSMASSNRIFCSPKDNLIKLGRATQNMDNFQIENVDRRVKMYTDFWVGVGMVIPEVFFCNDQV
jgi:hypothetical protein